MDEILQLLAGGDFVTGEAMSTRLGISRMAVHKRIEVLRSQGLPIEARHRLGYRLQRPGDVLHPALLTQGLATRWAGQALLCLAEAPSTNGVLKEMAAGGAPHGQVVLAESQQAGRGRRGRGWASPPGLGLWMSLLLRPEIAPPAAPGLTLLAALAVCDAVRSLYGLDPAIKWPNDVLVGGKKLAGILLEISAEQDRLHWVVLGIGINVHHQQGDFGPELSGRATSLALSGAGDAPRGPLLRALLEALEARYEAFVQGGLAALLPDYNRCSLTLGRRVRVEGADVAFEGVARSVDDTGALWIELDDGTRRQVWAGDVSIRGMMGYGD